MRHASRLGGCHAPAAMCPNASPDSCRQRPRRGQAEHRCTLKRWRNSLTRAKRRRWRPRVHGEREDGVSKLRHLERTSSRKDGNDATARGDRRCTVKDGSSSLARANRRQWRTRADSERKDRVSCLRKLDIDWDEERKPRSPRSETRGATERLRRRWTMSRRSRRGEERGHFDDSEEEEEEDTRVLLQRLGDCGMLRIYGAERGATVVEQPSSSGGRLGLGSEDRTVGVKPPQSAPVQPRGVINIDAAYFLEWKNGVRTKREFAINPSQVIDIREWEAAYNQRSLDPVQIQAIIDAMTTAYSQTEKTYELPTLKLAPLGLVKLTPGVRADRLKPEDWKDKLAGQYYYYIVAGQHNAAAARALLGTDVAVRYNFERWPAQMVYFSDEDFEGYFLVSAEDNKKDLKAPPRQLKLSMRDIRWCWKELGFPKAVMGNPSGKRAQVETWRRFCAEALHRTPYNHLWTLADDKTEQGIKKQNAALRSYFPLAMAGKSTWETGMKFFERWETGRLLASEGAKWIAKKKKVHGLKPGVSHIENEKDGRKVVVYNVPVEGPQKKGKKEKEPGDWFVHVTEPDPHCWKSMEALTDNEKCRLLKKVLNCEVVWVQTGSSALAKQGKLGMQEAVQLVKCDRILVRLWNYYQFKQKNRPDSDWTTKYPFLKKREAVLAKFEGQGLDAALWDGSRKLVSDSSLFKDCPPYMGCEDDKSIKATEKLPVLRLESYGALIDADEESLTGVVFDTGAPEEDSDTKEIDIDYRLAPVLPSPASSSASPSTNRPAQATPVRRTPSKLLARLTPRPAAPPPLRPGCQVPLQHPSRKDENIHFKGHDHTHSTEADWGHDMIWHPGTIQPAIRKGEWVMAIVDTDGEWKPSERLAKSDYLDIARSVVVDKVTLENSNLQPADLAIIATADRLFREIHDKQWLELSDDFYDLETSPSKKKVNWKVPPSRGTQGSVGGGPLRPPAAGGGGGSGHEEGGGGGSGHTTSGGSAPASSPAPGGQGRIAHSGVGKGGVNVTHSPTAGSGKSGKFSHIRTSQTEDPVPVEAAKSAGIRTLTTLEQAALPSWTAFGSSGEVGRGSCAGDPVSAVKGKSTGIPARADDVQASVPVQWSSTGAQASEMGATLAVWEATPPALGQGRSAESRREIAGGAPSAFLATKSTGIRTSSVTCLQLEEAGTE
ncbi:hypothetical protein CBR_g2749 [Chara braunii]|uniref:Uncharacterized protein n=1 Tax=Chara braunii TaxID=69332 RepID=A0A388KDW7_CHABU|nr:hypothetical protein CBR_g2749 [Chara braunii]|eukprot:GBG68197.1 hypothetical protein CBR_g2749 [Chara braunii]